MWFDPGDVILIDSPSSILESYKEKFSGKLVFNPKEIIIQKKIDKLSGQIH